MVLGGTTTPWLNLELGRNLPKTRTHPRTSPRSAACPPFPKKPPHPAPGWWRRGRPSGVGAGARSPPEPPHPHSSSGKLSGGLPPPPHTHTLTLGRRCGGRRGGAGRRGWRLEAPWLRLCVCVCGVCARRGGPAACLPPSLPASRLPPGLLAPGRAVT